MKSLIVVLLAAGALAQQVSGPSTGGGGGGGGGITSGTGVYASLPASGTNVGDTYHATDVPFDFTWSGSAWTPIERVSLLSESAKNYGSPGSTSQKAVTWNNTTVNTLLNYSGGSPGYVSNIWLAVDGGGDSASTIQIYVDGNVSPQINCPINLFFAKILANGVGPTQGYSRYISTPAASAYNVYIPIPFSTGVKITITNASGSNLTVWSNVSYLTGIPNLWKRTRKLFVSTQFYGDFAPYSVNTMINLSSSTPGRLLGIVFGVDGNGSLSGSFAWAEGPITITSDGVQVLNSSGTEDYFGATGYWSNMPAATYTDSFGLTFKSTGSGGIAFAYRLHVLDPIAWNSSFSMTWTAGIQTVVAFTGTGKLTYCIWYYTE